MIAYDDRSGSTHTVRRSAAWPLTRLYAGDAVEVIYLARRPEKGVVNCWDELYFAPLFFGATWISPEFVENLRPGFLAGMPMLFVTEFVFSHAAAGMGVSAKFKGIGKWLFVVFLVLIYGMWFVLLVKWGYGIQAAFFLWLTAGRIYRAENSFRPSGRGDEARERMAADLALPAVLRLFFLLLCMVVSLAVPLPQLGLAHYHATAGSGALLDRQERMVFLLMVYFASIPWMERHVFPRVVRVFNP